MRHLYTIVIVVFIHFLSFQGVKGKLNSVRATTTSGLSVAINKQQFIFSKKGKSSFQKSSFEDLPALQQILKKTSFGLYHLAKRQDKQTISNSLITKFYNSSPFSCYACIFNFLYPKHVFW